MKASTLRWAFLLAIGGAVGFQFGRDHFSVKANVAPAPNVYELAEDSDCVPD
jgi:hypothetical protein